MTIARAHHGGVGAPTAWGEAFTVDDLEAAVASCWLVDPDPGDPSLVAMDLVDGRYAEVGQASGKQEWTAQRPFPVTVRPADLVSGLRRGD